MDTGLLGAMVIPVLLALELPSNGRKGSQWILRYRIDLAIELFDPPVPEMCQNVRL